MKGLLKIDCIMHRVTDLDAATKFYTEVMGLRVGWTDKEHGMIGLLFPGNNSELVIHTDSSLRNPSYSFSVENVEEFCKTFKERGYMVVENTQYWRTPMETLSRLLIYRNSGELLNSTRVLSPLVPESRGKWYSLPEIDEVNVEL